MMINASGMHFKDLNEQIREADGTEVTVENCCGQRYIGSGLSGKHIHIVGTPGNALGAVSYTHLDVYKRQVSRRNQSSCKAS